MFFHRLLGLYPPLVVERNHLYCLLISQPPPFFLYCRGRGLQPEGGAAWTLEFFGGIGTLRCTRENCAEYGMTSARMRLAESGRKKAVWSGEFVNGLSFELALRTSRLEGCYRAVIRFSDPDIHLSIRHLRLLCLR